MDSPDEYPVLIQPDGNIKLKVEKMEQDRLYHCVHDETVFLFFVDDAGLNCYEIKDPETVAEIASNPAQIESILARLSKGEQNPSNRQTL